MPRGPLVSLRDLYVADLHDLYGSEQRFLELVPELAAAATSAPLRQAIEDQYETAQIHIERLDLLFRRLDERPAPEDDPLIQALAQATRRHLVSAERGEVQDAAIIGAAQRLAHHAIASYGCSRAYARALGDAHAERVLDQSLGEARAIDERLTQLAEDINVAAGSGLVEHPTTYRSRLRYLDLRDCRLERTRVASAAGDALGTLDGLVLDDASGRPVYLVIDSGGWFLGRRYLMPVGLLERDADGTLHSDLNRDTLRRYPEFNPQAFLAMDDDQAARYEHRLLSAVVPARTEGTRDRGRLVYEELQSFRTPDWLAPGVWVTDQAGFAATPPRSTPDLVPPAHYPPTSPATPPPAPAVEPAASAGPPHEEAVPLPSGQERLVARGDEHRIERYGER